MPLAPLGITDLRFTEEIAWSRERELNPQPTAYKAVAQPLCYRGSLASAVFHYFKKIRLSRSMPDGTLAHLRLAEREGFDPPCPLGLRFSRPTHLPILPPLQMVAREGVAPPSLGYGPCMLLLHHRAIEIIGTERFELPTFCAQGRCTTRLC